MKRLILMLQFLTKLPLPFNIQADEEDFSKGIIYFPVVGLIIGFLLAGVYLGIEFISNKMIATVVVVGFEVFITGGLHLDGLADTFDGLYSYRDKERMLEIMKDSRVGTNGVLVLIFSLVFKLVLIYSIEMPVNLLIVMPVLGRFMVVFMSRISTYARKNGMGGFFIGKTTTPQLIIALFITLLVHIIQPALLWVSLIVLVLMVVYRYHVYLKIDGITGDILGAIVEMSEVLFLFIYILMLGA